MRPYNANRKEWWRLGCFRLFPIVTQAEGQQRAGRAGRTGPGTAYRLYTEEAFR